MKISFVMIFAMLFAGCIKYNPYNPKDIVRVKPGSIRHIKGNEYEATVIKDWNHKEWKVFITGEEVPKWKDKKTFGVFREQPAPDWVRQLASYKEEK